jgi:phosphinothricin acetyltransferase
VLDYVKKVVSGLRIRTACRADLSALVEIHNYYIEHSNATFDTRPLSAKERQHWLDKYSETGPHRLFVAEENLQILGYASSQRYREHPAFEQTIETSIYLAPDCVGQGVGSALYLHLFEALRGQTLHLAVAGIALPNDASVALHKKFGFKEVGTFEEYAVKHGKFISSIWLQKKL